MIINIPLQIDEATFEQKVRDDYAKSVRELLLAKVEQVLEEHDNRYYMSRKDSKIGLEKMMTDELDIFLENNRDEIIEIAAGKLAERLARTKKAKAILEGMELE